MSFLVQQEKESDGNNPDFALGPDGKQQDLLIFGYQCKLFRDDQKAVAIDNGEHLIPWMGDHSLKIDRYDGRGHLFDLRPYDADYTAQKGELSSDEKRIERLCEEERYLELHTDIAERAIQEEEEIKRLNMELASSSGYQAVGFSYDQQGSDDAAKKNVTQNDSGESESVDDEEDFEFVPPRELCLPKSMTFPTGTKLNSLIEKTAKFVSSHGGQMEIMIKTKQANNPQFKFLNFEHHLNPYYKHQVYMIKSGRYNPDIHNKPPPPKTADPSKADNDDDDEADEADGSGYLHPSLLAKSNTSQSHKDATSSVPQFTQSQLENTAYGKLLKKISDNLPSITNSPQRMGTPTYSDADSNSQSAFTDQAPNTAADSAQMQHLLEGQSYVGADGYAYDPSYYSQYYQDYSSTTTDAIPQSSERPPSPADDIKPLIERLIGYIKKDGEAFEKQVLLRNDERFSFLHPGDASYEYYKWRKESVLEEQNKEQSKSKGVSFSIKQKDPEVSSIDTSRVALPVDPESDEEQANSENANNSKEAAAQGNSSSQYVPTPLPSETTKVEDKPPPSDELIQKKLAEQKLRDKLAAAAREKMTQVTQNTKEKSLQAERKKKAAMFVNMLKSKQKPESSSAAPIIGPELPTDRSFSPDTLAIESRLAEDLDNDYSVSRTSHSKPRSPPSAYSVRINRERNSGRHDTRHETRHESREHRHKRHTDRSSHHRKRRSPSPLLPAAKKHRTQRASPVESTLAPPLLPRAATEVSRNEVTYHSRSPQTEDDVSNRDDNEFRLKVRKMLRESRQAVYKEDLFGN